MHKPATPLFALLQSVVRARGASKPGIKAIARAERNYRLDSRPVFWLSVIGLFLIVVDFIVFSTGFRRFLDSGANSRRIEGAKPSEMVNPKDVLISDDAINGRISRSFIDILDSFRRQVQWFTSDSMSLVPTLNLEVLNANAGGESGYIVPVLNIARARTLYTKFGASPRGIISTTACP